ncbi:transposase [Escherichia coli]|nr:transposase [Escherichia coli]KHI88582.1 transposase [Escherichia coli]KIG82466.1 transposase [Escherichia coli]KIH33845.1 transposase [Escherichia coli]KLG60369.1 transposase [Escherichia coli]
MICSPQNNTGAPMKKRNFSAEFKRESAQLVVDQITKHSQCQFL